MPTPASRYRASPRDRAVSFVLAGITSLLILATMLAMGSFDAPGGKRGGRLVAISLVGEAARPEQRSAAKARKAAVAPAPAAATRQAMAPRIALPSKNPAQLHEGFIQLSRADMAAADIGRMRAAPAASGGNEAADGGGGSGAGEGPGGARLYNAQWHREPTRAELGGYMRSGGAPGEWAMIACRTIEQYHVEDCRELDESPRGSGMARALRQAAWQFLVRPPRIDGKPMIGAWVRIRFDFTKGRRDEAG